eukprot:259029-Rhodomonas_salina.2
MRLPGAARTATGMAEVKSAMTLRASYAMPGTDTAYGAVCPGTDLSRVLLSPYARATRCLAVAARTGVAPPYQRRSMLPKVLRVRYTLSGTDAGYLLPGSGAVQVGGSCRRWAGTTPTTSTTTTS